MRKTLLVILVGVLVLSSLTAYGQMLKRQDAIWARTTTSPITLDGLLNEAAWATAESVVVRYGVPGLWPGSGWFAENGKNSPPADPTNATIKFLVKGDSLYVGVVARDKSVGGGLFNQFDGFLMNMRDKSKTDRPVPNFEYFYGWVTEPWADTTLIGKGTLPGFFGWAGGPRTDSLRNIWDAVTTVQGISNSDTAADQSWTTELKFNLKLRGYNVSQAGGDVVMWNISIYDADYRWPVDTSKVSGNRTWLQCPWGNGAWFAHMKIFARPDVTTTGAVPAIDADLRVPNGQNYATPVFDGKLNDQVWQYAPSVKIKFGDATIRNAYPTTLPFRSGQFQPDVNGGKAAVTDASLATVKYFYKADTLFLGFDVSDRVVQSVENSDRYDGFTVSFNVKDSLTEDNHVLLGRNFGFVVSPTGSATRIQDLASWDSLGTRVPVALSLKGGTTVDTLGTSADSGYTAEMKIYLRQFGYPAGRGDGIAFLGITYYDGDSFTPASNSYGTRTWMGRRSSTPWEDSDAPAWVYMDPAFLLTDVESPGSTIPAEFTLLGNYPNPFNPSTTIKFQLSRTSEVTLQVYDMLGRLVTEQTLGIREAGDQTVQFNAGSLASGVYHYRLRMAVGNAMVTGRMLLLK